MFNTLASYLLGTSNQQEPTGGVEERNVRLTSVISEDDWVLVDRDSEGNSEVESSSTESLDGYSNLNNHNQLPHLLTRSSSTASLPCTTMEESWFVTPPPCFTSAGPVHMETSPLENLLIEHPSMSVYQHSHPALVTQRHNPVVPVQSVDTSDFSADEDEELVVAIPVQQENTVRNRFGIPYRLRVQLEAMYRERHLRAQRRNRIDVLREKEKQVVVENKRAQKVQVQKACQSLKRKYLDRANKAREVNCRNRHQRRSERSQGATRSYANNNRKC